MRFSSGENKIGVYEASAYCLGDIIGSGIFVSPTSILKRTGSFGLSICVWILCAFIALIGAMVYVELGTCIRKSGCDFAYLVHVRWNAIAVAFLWVSAMFTYPTILAIQTLAFGEYMVQGLNKLYCISGDMMLVRLLAYSAMLCIAFINLFSLQKFAGRFQVVVTGSKMSVIVIVIVTGFYNILVNGRTEHFQRPFANSKTDSGNLVLAVFAGLYAYNGWDILNFGSEEIENPRRTLPIAAVFGIGVSAVVYVLINFAYFSVMTVDEFLSSDAVAAKFAEATLGDVSYVVPFFIGLLLLGNFNTTIFGCSRYLFAGARHNCVPTLIKCVHERSASPRAAVVVAVAISLVVSFIGDLDALIGYMSFAIWMQRTFSMLALLYMRHQRWHFPKDAFRTPIAFPIAFLFICLSLLTVSAVNDPHIAVYGVSIVIIGLFIYAVFIYPDSRPHCVRKLNEYSVIATQVSLNVMPVSSDDEDEVE